MKHQAYEILKQLIRYPSITPTDADCQTYLINLLQSVGFVCQRFDKPPVSNFYAQFGDRKPLLIFAGHTDVVPIGDETQWHTDPFQLIHQDDYLYGRGVADMKGGIACMIAAVMNFIVEHPTFPGSIGFLITSGEEGEHYTLGSAYVMEQLQAREIHPDFCIVGEPSSRQQVGDIIKVGRRGSLSGYSIIHGKQGHVAYPQLAMNPIHLLAPVLQELTATIWDQGNAYFPPTSLQITHLQAGGQANNIIPGTLLLDFNFRYCPEQTAEGLQQAVLACFQRHQVPVEIKWQHSGEPFLTAQGRLLDVCQAVIIKQLGKAPELSTTGGTSDGRFIAPYGIEVIELGLCNATIHQVNERIAFNELRQLTSLYYDICCQLF